tara:strand:- start:291 stop:548 length:258 start_codon:yes stop_codon:yes gene_type:complete
MNWDIVILIGFFIIFVMFCRNDWKLYKKEKEKLKRLYEKTDMDYKNYESNSAFDETLASKEMYQEIKKKQLNDELIQRINESNES